jgi:hypothetical protein
LVFATFCYSFDAFFITKFADRRQPTAVTRYRPLKDLAVLDFDGPAIGGG